MTGDFLISSHLGLKPLPVAWITAYDGIFCAVPCVLIFVALSPFLIYPPQSHTPGSMLPLASGHNLGLETSVCITGVGRTEIILSLSKLNSPF